MMNIIVAWSLHICIIMSLGFIFRNGITNSQRINIFKLLHALYQIIQKVYANVNTLSLPLARPLVTIRHCYFIILESQREWEDMEFGFIMRCYFGF